MPRKFFMAFIAGVALVMAAPVLSHEEDDEDEDDWREYRRDYDRKKRKHRDRYFPHFHYERPPMVIYREPPGLPRRYRDRSATPPTKEPALKGPEGFPKESPADRAAARERQRDILEKEFAAEQTLLAQAKKELAERSARLGVNRPNGEASEDLQTYKDSVETHERNIEALKRELKNLDR